jgi:hypothetical protein
MWVNFQEIFQWQDLRLDGYLRVFWQEFAMDFAFRPHHSARNRKTYHDGRHDHLRPLHVSVTETRASGGATPSRRVVLPVFLLLHFAKKK